MRVCVSAGVVCAHTPGGHARNGEMREVWTRARSKSRCELEQAAQQLSCVMSVSVCASQTEEPRWRAPDTTRASRRAESYRTIRIPHRHAPDPGARAAPGSL